MERFFYHALIRPNSSLRERHSTFSDRIQNGDYKDSCINALLMVLKWGLLLTPEERPVTLHNNRRNAKKSASLGLQSRACFTLASQNELASPRNGLTNHFDDFGPIALAFASNSRGPLGLIPCHYYYARNEGDENAELAQFSEFLLDALYQVSDVVLCAAIAEAKSRSYWDDDDADQILSEFDLARFGYNFHSTDSDRLEAIANSLSPLSARKAKELCSLLGVRRYSFGVLWQALDMVLMNFQSTDAVTRKVPEPLL